MSHNVWPSTSSVSLSLSACSHTSHSEPNQCEFTLLLLSWVLPGSGSCAAELTHSSPGPMLPQSTAAPLRTLEYSSAARPGQPGGRRQENGSQVTSRFLCFFWFFCGRGAGIGVSILSESAFNTGTGNMTLNPGRWHTTPQPLFEQRPTISAFVGGEDQTAEVGNGRGCWARSGFSWTLMTSFARNYGNKQKKAQVQHFFFMSTGTSTDWGPFSPCTALISGVNSNFLYFELLLFFFLLSPFPPRRPPPRPKAENLWSQDFYLAHRSCGHVKSEARGRS